MSDLAELITAIAALVTAGGTVVALVITALRTGRRERTASAKTVAEAAVDRTVDPDAEQDRRLEQLERRLREVGGDDDQ